MINNQLIIAKRYAHAFLNVFSLSFADVQKLNNAINFLQQHPEIATFLKIPLLDPQIKLEALKESVIKKFDLPASFDLIVELLIHKKRSELLLQVLEQIKKDYQDQQNIKLFTISSSTELADEQKKVLEQYLISTTDATIDARYTIDKKLIAGIRMQSDELQWEYSIAKQLKKIRATLIG
jgi:F-type H+-transporting ATPase subunit delta